ncbi:hypothetical protein Microterr_00350 [Microbacterium terricola]|uniref:Uncharacterized protein n=1 Tax=Microbacterium terricola TaxID=344163 RepID=A0ABM8DUW8_9MICO|nr:hypothetical protein Microterr_00350 [Microbacterium terricola]
MPLWGGDVGEHSRVKPDAVSARTVRPPLTEKVWLRAKAGHEGCGEAVGHREPAKILCNLSWRIVEIIGRWSYRDSVGGSQQGIGHRRTTESELLAIVEISSVGCPYLSGLKNLNQSQTTCVVINSRRQGFRGAVMRHIAESTADRRQTPPIDQRKLVRVRARASRIPLRL